MSLVANARRFFRVPTLSLRARVRLALDLYLQRHGYCRVTDTQYQTGFMAGAKHAAREFERRINQMAKGKGIKFHAKVSR